MSRSTFTLYVGVFSVALNFIMICLTVLFTFFFAYATDVMEDSDEISEETQDVVKEVYEGFGGYAIFLMIDFVFMFFASLLMIYGVHKERHSYIAPWVFLSAIGLVLQLVVLFIEIGEEEKHSHMFSVVVSCILGAAIWFPIFSYYKCLRHQSIEAKKACTAAITAPAYVAPVAPVAQCSAPAEFSHANAKYVPTYTAAEEHVVYPSVTVYKQ